jgi:hypothetical protein
MVEIISKSFSIIKVVSFRLGWRTAFLVAQGLHAFASVG